MDKRQINSGLTPIERKTDVVYSSKDSTTYVVRSMYPITEAMAITVHKSQGTTIFKGVIIHASKFMTKRHWYVAMSRVPSLNDLYIKGNFTIPSATASEVTDNEMQRMRADCKIEFKLQFPQNDTTDTSTLMYHNARSIHKHQRILETDKAFSSSDCIMLVETWLLPTDILNVRNYITLHRNDCSQNRRHAFGSILLVKEELKSVVQIIDNHTYFEKKHFLDTVSYLFKNCLITFFHRSPRYSFIGMLLFFDFIINKGHCMNIRDMVIIGDFNTNLMQESNEKSQLLRFMTHNGFHQCQNNNFPTTDNNTMIDLCFSNIQNLKCHIYESITSDHKPLYFYLCKYPNMHIKTV